MTCTEAQKRAFKRYYEKNREVKIEKAKEYFKQHYVPVEKKIKPPTITKKEARTIFINEMIPLITEKLHPKEFSEMRIPEFKDGDYQYYNFRKLILDGIRPIIEIYISRINLKYNINESAWFYLKQENEKYSKKIVVGDWVIAEYSKNKI
jgi:hypothetical protein